VTTLPVTGTPQPPSSTKAGIMPYTPFAALLGCGCGILLLRIRKTL
jgi:hypothetical protein